jgi:hypothetical protein
VADYGRRRKEVLGAAAYLGRARAALRLSQTSIEYNSLAAARSQILFRP